MCSILTHRDSLLLGTVLRTRRGLVWGDLATCTTAPDQWDGDDHG